MTKTRANWGSKFAFILAASGSAIGLGNIWRFPTVAYQNGGAIFVQVYILIVFLIGFVVLIGEISLGRHTQRNPVGAFSRLAPGSAWKLAGEIKKLGARRIESIENLLHEEKPYIKVVQSIFPNTTIHIGHLKKRITTVMRNKRFIYHKSSVL